MSYPERAYQKKIETELVALGFDVQEHQDKYVRYIPDVSFSGYQRDWWVEIKWVRDIEKPLSVEHLTPGQVAWLRDRARSGRSRCCVLVGSPSEQRLIDATTLRVNGSGWEVVGDGYLVACDGSPERMAGQIKRYCVENFE